MRRKTITTEMMKSYIVESLLILLKDNHFSEITISQITNKAGVNRSTYYRHFNSKEDIILYYFDRILTEAFEKAAHEPPFSESYLEIIFESFLNYKEHLLLLYQNNLYVLLLDILKNHFYPTIAQAADLKTQYIMSYHVGGVFSHLLFWFSRGMEELPSELSQVAPNILSEIFSPYMLVSKEE